MQSGVSAVILAADEGTRFPEFSGVEAVLETIRTDIRLFGKPLTRPYRRMGVVLAYDGLNTDMNALRSKTRTLAAGVKVH